jgi:DNA-directed RNA polymerase specialized sigma24 family protein
VPTHDIASIAVHDLYSSHHRWLQGWLRKKLGCTWDAADLAQDTFLRVLLKRQAEVQQGLDAPRALEQAWLETLSLMPEPQTPSPETRQMVLQALVAIDAMLDQLKPQVRAAFLWARLEALTCPQIAERLGVSLATAERYIATALRHCYALRFHD